MIIRVRGGIGVTRIEVGEELSSVDLYKLVASEVAEVKDGAKFILSSDPQAEQVLSPSDNRNLSLSHGDMIFLRAMGDKATSTTSATTIKLDAVDEWLERQSGRIERKRDPQYCKHGPTGMCSHCQPLEPFDPKYTEEKGIKHLSFHAYRRKLGASTSGSSSSATVLEEPEYRVKPNCPRHAPYPAAICSLCQPSAISLKQQPFRMTDHVEFESPQLIEAFLSRWRRTGYQNFGWLYGRYEPYEVVQLGIKAVVSAIYEPKQDGSIDGFSLSEENTEEKTVEEAARLLNLQRIGMIYTDLRDDGSGQGKVECRRGANSFFLSASEVIFAAEQQMRHPSPCRRSPSGAFGSKFVTVVLSGDESNDVGVFAYQVSLQAMAMVKADLITATTDPALLMVKPSTPTHYVPDVIYSYNSNEYGAQISTFAKPTFPADYLLLSLSHGFPVQGDPLFNPSVVYPPLSKGPTAKDLLSFILPIPSNTDGLVRCLANFNWFVHLCSQGAFTREQLALLAEGIVNRSAAHLTEFTKTAAWNALLGAKDDDNSSSLSSAVGSRATPTSEDANWTCPHCTFINSQIRSTDSCEVCGLPRRWDP